MKLTDRLRNRLQRIRTKYPLATTIVKFVTLFLAITITAFGVVYLDRAIDTEGYQHQQQYEQQRAHHRDLLIQRFGKEQANRMDILVDQTNGITYIVKRDSITPLLDDDGTPHIDEQWLEQHQQ